MTLLATERALAQPPTSLGASLLALPEDQWFDRKSVRVAAKDLADSLIGFANADGGIIVVGLSDGTVEGTDRDPGARNDHMQASVDHCVPPVRVKSTLVACLNSAGSADHLLVIEVRPGEGVVHANRRDVAFLRVGDENRRLSFAQRQELVFDRGQGDFEGKSSGVSVTDVDQDLVEEYRVAAQAPDAHRLLVARGLAVGDMLNHAGCLLFGQAPQQVLPEAYLRVLRYRGTQRGTGSRQQLQEDRRIEGPIPRQILAARDAVRELQPRRRALQAAAGRFEMVGLVPEDAWLEGIVNAAVHRSYSLVGDHTRIEIFDDRIEITSPGRFPGIVGLSGPLDSPRFARNPRIARVCAELTLGQELGEGIRRMYEEMEVAGLSDPLYEQTSASVRLSLSAEPVNRELEARLPPESRRILAAVRESGRMSTSDVASALRVSRPTTLKRLRRLQAEGLLEWIGQSPQDPRAYWRLPEADA